MSYCIKLAIRKFSTFTRFQIFSRSKVNQIEARIIVLEDKLKIGRIDKAKKVEMYFFLGHIHLIRNV